MFEVIGIITTAVIALIIIHKVYQKFYPKKYTWETCPNDHDTMSRYGASRCEKCNSILNEYE